MSLGMSSHSQMGKLGVGFCSRPTFPDSDSLLTMSSQFALDFAPNCCGTLVSQSSRRRAMRGGGDVTDDGGGGRRTDGCASSLCLKLSFLTAMQHIQAPAFREEEESPAELHLDPCARPITPLVLVVVVVLEVPVQKAVRSEHTQKPERESGQT
ncbi:unnamed protein product [Pleuronectes platessa]|uniref:Uncharacterized protein n=1 Tax=Pleuronectes platessa TaxID=8262 RepID=A0A9N7YSP8_PLEPL|nr:unnamed protein product [Pleuronectes platessa]